jgi:hypothetical protein
MLLLNDDEKGVIAFSPIRERSTIRPKLLYHIGLGVKRSIWKSPFLHAEFDRQILYLYRHERWQMCVMMMGRGRGAMLRPFLFQCRPRVILKGNEEGREPPPKRRPPRCGFTCAALFLMPDTE